MQSLQRARAPRTCANVRRIVSLTDNPPVLRCCGDEDRSTQSLRRPALSRALAVEDDLVVDLSELSFADASLMVDLAMVARRLRKAGRQMRMSGASPTIHTLIEMVGLHRLQGVHVDAVAPAPAAG